jgi:A/G-specific adenine glycosylase
VPAVLTDVLARRARVNAALLAWYERSGREGLPWRRRRDPYLTLVSEFMLQQTQVERAIGPFERFVAAWPALPALAAAQRADVVRAWRGLGYNSRAVRLHALAQAVVNGHGGALPREEAALRALPGIGPYTARAIRAFGFDCDEAAVDTNVRRVIHRVYLGIESPPRASERELERAAQAALAPGRGHDWNGALMDLGATICTARAPKCLVCPLREDCAAAPIDAAALAELARRHARRRPPGERVPFEQTRRYARGRVIDRLRALPAHGAISLLALGPELPELAGRPPGELLGIIDDLVRDGLVVRSGEGVRLA